jgi:hypothetical protein
MIFDHDREPTIIGTDGKALGHGPALERAFRFETQIEMQSSGSVLLHHESERPAMGRHCASRLGRFSEFALGSILR